MFIIKNIFLKLNISNSRVFFLLIYDFSNIFKNVFVCDYKLSDSFIEIHSRAYTRGGGAKGALTQNFHTFPNLKLKSEEHKKLVFCLFSALKKLYTWTRPTMTEVRIKNLFRINIHLNRMGAFKENEEKQLFLNAMPQWLDFLVS